jgi:hypothetical protein
MVKIYLDNCCYNRPFDDQEQDIVRLETEAKLIIQDRIRAGKYSLVWSFILNAENDENLLIDKQISIGSGNMLRANTVMLRMKFIRWLKNIYPQA